MSIAPTPTLVTDEVNLLTADKPYIIKDRPTQPFTVTVPGYYWAYVSARGRFMIQRLDPALPVVRC